MFISGCKVRMLFQFWSMIIKDQITFFPYTMLHNKIFSFFVYHFSGLFNDKRITEMMALINFFGL